ncbi:tetratricopeptide repeat protein [Micromonospora antibiotica]|uniref:Tetratricopeptide repeat protein n=1 Tax=Micromonospora antibiotica TaxID=2807623 RepID=A0ABS3VDQ6_9ACTN|nr:tetratricopeptide repeat protein [Micromonospora antibiotica]MBO4163702.1 tetratricopeptide repeat protein [Micromonospora antibiotica]
MNRGAWRRHAWWVGIPGVVAGFGAWAAVADDKTGWTVVAAAAAGVVGGFGPTVADRLAATREARRRREDALRGVTSAELPESVAWLLHPGQAVVDFIGRGWVLRQLESWTTDRTAVAVRLLTGAGGVGKTRLAREFAGRLPGWRCEWIHAGAEEQTAALIASGGVPERLLVVVDYAETRDRAGVAALVCAAQRATGVRVRVLLIARGAGLWWETLSAAYPQQAQLLDAVTGRSQVVELPARIEESEPGEIVALAARDFAAHLGRPVPVVEARDRPADTPVLRLHAEALLTVLDGQPRHGRYDVLTEVLGHEARYWRFAARRAGLLAADDPASDALLRQVAGVAALLGADGPDEVAGLVRRVPALVAAEPDRVDRYAAWLADLYPATDGTGLGVVQPDLLAEALAVRVLRDYPAADWARVFTDLTVAQAVRALTVLGRARTHQGDATALIEVALGVDVPRMVEAVLQVGVQFPGVFTPGAVRLLADADIDLDWAQWTAEHVPYPSMELGRLAVALTTRIVAGFTPDTPREVHARWMSTHSIRLAEIGRRAEALVASHEAVYLRRELTITNRDAHLPDLAKSLNNHANRLTEAGQHTEALTTSHEAVNLYRQLTTTNRDAYLPYLAGSLNNHANRLTQAGQHTEALTTSHEAVNLYRQLFTTNRDSHLAYIAMSLNNHANRLAEAGQHTEALTTSHEAVNLYRQLTTTNRDAHLPALANSLWNIGYVGLIAGSVTEDVIALTAEGVRYLNELATAYPAAFEERRQAARRTLDELHRAAAGTEVNETLTDTEE